MSDRFAEKHALQVKLRCLLLSVFCRTGERRVPLSSALSAAEGIAAMRRFI
jgi:hypothetical protein